MWRCPWLIKEYFIPAGRSWHLDSRVWWNREAYKRWCKHRRETHICSIILPRISPCCHDNRLRALSWYLLDLNLWLYPMNFLILPWSRRTCPVTWFLVYSEQFSLVESLKLNSSSSRPGNLNVLYTSLLYGFKDKCKMLNKSNGGLHWMNILNTRIAFNCG